MQDQNRCGEKPKHKNGEEPKRTLLSLIRADIDEESAVGALSIDDTS